MDNNSTLARAIFLDRDGTILKEIYQENTKIDGILGYVTSVDQVELIAESAKAVALAKHLGFKVIIISNQSAIARGWITENQLEEINNEMYRQLLKEEPEAIIDDLFYSPYHKEGKIEKYKIDSPRRKPGIGMILEAKEKHNLDLSSSYFIGDSFNDMKCAENAGIKKILVLTGYGKKAYKICLDDGMNIDFIAENLYDSIRFIERQ